MNKHMYDYYLTCNEWNVRANEIKKRDNYTCQDCGSFSKLEVHHLKYKGDLLPWLYEDEELITLCKKCHKSWHLGDRTIKGLISEMYISGLLPKEIIQIFKK